MSGDRDRPDKWIGVEPGAGHYGAQALAIFQESHFWWGHVSVPIHTHQPETRKTLKLNEIIVIPTLTDIHP